MINNLQELFNSDLKYLYDAERRLANIMPEISKVVSSSELKDLLEKHTDENKNHIQRLETISQDINVDIQGEGKVSKGMEGLQKEMNDLIDKSNGLQGAVLDAAIIAALQRIQHYEIASYGTLRTYADILNLKDVSAAFQEILNEESKVDELLTDIATSSVNIEASKS